jgi:hypothetical protein
MMFCGTDPALKMHCDATLEQDQTTSKCEVISTEEAESRGLQGELLVPTTLREDENMAIEATEGLIADPVQSRDDADDGSEVTKGDEFVEQPQERRSGRAPKPTERGLEYIAQRPSGVLVQLVPDNHARFGSSSLPNSSRLVVRKIHVVTNDASHQNEQSGLELVANVRQPAAAAAAAAVARRNQVELEDTVLINVGNSSGREAIVKSRRKSGKFVVMVDAKDGMGESRKVLIRNSSITLLKKAGELSGSSISDTDNANKPIVHATIHNQQQQQQVAVNTNTVDER